MFAGKYNHNIDGKGRIIIPSKFREELGDALIVTFGLDGCLYLYSREEWNNFLEELKKLPGTREGRALKRHFTAHSEECEIDKQGRTLIPAEFRNQAGLAKEVVLVGFINKVELWSKEKWDETNTPASVDDLADNLAEYGINF